MLAGTGTKLFWAGAWLAALSLAAHVSAQEDDQLHFRLREMSVAPAEALQVVDGQDALVHVFQEGKRVILQGVPKDWSGYQALAFTISCKKPLAGRYSIIIHSENQATPGIDYFALTIPARFSGTQNVVFPLAKLGKAREPIGWTKVDSINFHNDWSVQNPPDLDNVVVFSNLRLLRNETADGEKGPRLTDNEFFELLDLARPELAAVQKAWQDSNVAAAKQALAAHVRSRQQPRWWTDPKNRPSRGLPPENRRAEKGLGGRYQATMPLNWHGWQKLTLRREDFATIGNPLGWDRVSGLHLFWDAPLDLPAGTALHLRDITLQSGNARRRLGDFNDNPNGWDNLETDRDLAADGNGAGKWWFPDVYPNVVCKQFPADWDDWETLELMVHLPPEVNCGKLQVKVISTAPNTARADEILTRTFIIGNFRDNPYAFGERIDWSANAMSEGESRTIEWNAQLNRHFHFRYLTAAWWETGDEKYAQELADQMVGWIEDNPVLLLQSGNSPYHHAWETLNTGIRLHGSWPDAMAHCLESKAFTDEVIILIMKSMVEQARHLIQWPSTGNWRTAEAWGVYVTGLLYPEFKEAAEWRQFGIDSLYQQLQEEVYPDGLQYELALGYSNWTLREFTDLYNAAVLNGREHELPEDYFSHLEKMYAYLMANVMPGSVVFGLNDSGNSSVKRLLLNGYRLFKRPDFLYAATDGQAGEPPVTDSFGQEWVGHYVMRSGWHPKANVLHMDAGLQGRAHIHQDKLTVALTAYGHHLLVDGGVTMYDRSRWRAYQLLTRSHNTVLVDGMDQFIERSMTNMVWPLPWEGPKPPGSDTIWQSAPGVDYCQGWWKGKWREYVDSQNPATKDTKVLDTVQHRRAVLFVKPDIWIVLDTLLASDQEKHTAEVLYHIDAEQAEPQGTTVLATNKNLAGLLLAARPQGDLAVEVVTGKMEPPVQGWSANVRRNRPKGIPMSPVPTAIFRKTWQNRADIVSVIQPFPAKQIRATSVEPLFAAGDAQAARVKVDASQVYDWAHNELPGQEIAVFADQQKRELLLSTDGQTALAGGQGESLRLLLVQGKQLTTPEMQLSLGNVATAAVLALTPQTAVVSTDQNTEVKLRLPKVLAANLTLHALDRRGARTRPVDFVVNKEGFLTWTVQAGIEYELNWGGESVLAWRTAEEQAAAGILSLPVRPLAPLPPAPAETAILVQAEEFSAQGGGSVTVTDAKIGDSGRSFLNWDNVGHWLEYVVDIPVAGAYPLHIRHCSLGKTAVRAIMVDGYCPHDDMTNVTFAETGGWSSEHDNWKWTTVTDAAGKPFLFNLKKGRQVIKFVNRGNSLNLDVFCLGKKP